MRSRETRFRGLRLTSTMSTAGLLCLPVCARQRQRHAGCDERRAQRTRGDDERPREGAAPRRDEHYQPRGGETNEGHGQPTKNRGYRRHIRTLRRAQAKPPLRATEACTLNKDFGRYTQHIPFTPGSLCIRSELIVVGGHYSTRYRIFRTHRGGLESTEVGLKVVREWCVRQPFPRMTRVSNQKLCLRLKPSCGKSAGAARKISRSRAQAIRPVGALCDALDPPPPPLQSTPRCRGHAGCWPR